MTKETIFVTGGSGFIGYNLIKKLHEQGHAVRTLSRQSSVPYLQGLAEVAVQGDIRDADIVREAIEGSSVVYHLAGIQPTVSSSVSEMEMVAREGTRNVLDAARITGVRKVVAASSVMCCGFSTDGNLLTENDQVEHLGVGLPYTHSKLALEEECLGYKHDLEIMIARIGKVYGSGDFYGASSRIVGKMDKRFLPVPSGIGSYISVNDCVDALITIADQGTAGEKYIVSAENCSFLDIFSAFKDAAGGTAALLPLPKAAKFLLPLLRMIPGKESLYETLMSAFNNKPSSPEKLRALGWTPQKTIKDAIAECVEFYQWDRAWG